VPDIGYYTLPVLLSFDGVDKQVNGKLEKAFGDTGKKASASFAKAAGAGLKDLEAEVAKAAAAYDKLKDRAEDSLGKVRTAEAQLAAAREKGNNERIVAAEEKVAAARRNSVRATTEAKNAFDNLDGAQRKLGKGTDDLGGKFGGLSAIAGKSGEALVAAGAVAAGAATVGIAALAAGVVLAGKALYDLGGEFDDVFDNIRVKTGATGPQLEALEKATERLSTKVPLSIGEIGNVVAETSRALHLTGPELDNVAKSIANLGRLTGEDVDVRTLGKAFRGFGIDAKDQVPALDSLLQASQKTGVGVNELLGTMVKGGAGLRQFGFTFGESAALATQFEEAGLDADKAMGGLTKGLAALAKDGQTGQQALRANVDQIKSLIAVGNDAGALDLTNKMFGAKGGVQFFEAIKNGALDLDTLADSLGNTGDTIAQAAADTDDWAERWELFKNSIKVGLQPIATGVFDAVNGKLTELADWVDKHKPEVIGFFGDLAAAVTTKTAEALRGIASFISDGLVPILRSIEDFGKNNVLANLIPGAEELGGAAGMLADGLGKLPDKLNQAASATDSVTPKIKALADRAADAERFTGALGEATASLPDGKTIELSSNAPEVVEGLKDLGIEVTSLPGGKIGVTADTEEGRRIIQAFRDQETKAPITPTVKPQLAMTDVDVSIGNYFKNLRPIVTPQLPPGWGGGGGSFAGPPPAPTAPGTVGTPHRATGGIYDVWDSVASFANGKLPSQAMIQPPVAGAGLVQWAEPSTKGEAFIPLSGGARSAAIWAETGKRLGLFNKSFKSGGVLGDAGGLQPFTSELRALLAQTFPMITDIGGYRSPDGYNEHSSGRALDAMIPDWKSPAGIALGNKVAQWALSIPGVNRVMWQASIINKDGTSTPVPDRGSPTANHLDHVHIFTDQMPAVSVPTASLSSLSAAGGAGGMSFGSSGGGTPGVGPKGESGTYTSDPEKVAEAEGRVAEADAKVREAEAKQRELEADAKESQVISAQNDVDNAKRDAAKARKDVEDAKRGDFTADSKNSGERKKGFDQFGDVGSLLGGALKETLGFDGSFLPDLSNLAPVKAAGTLLDAFSGPLQGFVDGKLGIQQPGWKPGMPVNGVANDTGIGDATSSAPFGMPDVQLPQQLPDAPHAGTGAAPGPVQNVDQSIHYNGPVGSDPEAVRRNNLRLQEQRSLPRLNVGMGAGH